MPSYPQHLASLPSRAIGGLIKMLVAFVAIVSVFGYAVYRISPERTKAAWKAFKNPPAACDLIKAGAAAGKDADSPKPSADGKGEDAKPGDGKASDEKLPAGPKESLGPKPRSKAQAKDGMVEVVIYGREACGNTRAMRKGLKASDVPFRFVSVDEEKGQSEYFKKLSDAGHDAEKEDIVLPIVSVGDEVFVNPDAKKVVDTYQGK